ncbi:MAG TPA: DNA polymerase Y family protein [Pusillimonas sp.]|uniref:Y-family DNA polymerase n=1 Tax=unclassified Pusillimonas TaxID=2640016 RepID=UPI0026206984|nr:MULTISPECIES: DNA polymerase Y family protein [unclassified Pusillimonas]HLU18755.1 DNA polymerase Y family protein [Pusillimonas sp.]
MSLWISLHLPFHSLDAVFPLWSTKGLAAAVLDQDQVCALTPEAQEAGIVPGMRRGTAVALAPDVLLRRRDLQAEADGLRQALLCLLQYTPDIAILDPHSLVMDIAASLTLFGGPRALWRNVCRSLKGLGLTTRLAMAPTAQGAWALALQTQSRQRRVLRPRTLTKRLDSLPVDSLPALLPWLEWIHELGCFTLGQLRRLPRKGLQHRTRPEVIQTLDAAYGSSTPLYTWASLPETFQQRYETLQRLEHVHAVLGIAHVLVEQLCGWLQAGHSAADQLVFLLHHEKGRHARPPSRLMLSLSQAGWRPDDFLPALAEQFNRMVLVDHVIAVELIVEQTCERTPHNPGLFPEPAQWARQENHLLDLLRARLGEDRVLQPRPVASHLPEVANRWTPAGAIVQASKHSSGQAASATHRTPLQNRPFWLLDPPVALDVQQNSPFYQGRRLRLIQGPERLESGWWSDEGHQQRDYFIAQDAQYARYWIYRQRASISARWFLHGLFG